MPYLHTAPRARGVRNFPAPPLRRQTGLTLVEFMVSIVIGMLMIAALATLIADQSSTRGEIDRSGKMIENGRYALQAIASDVQLAGYWGELSSQPATPGGLPDPCSKAAADLEAAMALHVQGYDAPATLPAPLNACVTNHKPGTDVLVVRRVDPDLSSVLTGTDIDLAKVDPGRVYLQTGLNLSLDLASVLAIGSSDAAANATAFSLKKKGGVKVANLRKVVVHIYYISKCSVEVSGSCTGADGGTPIPTLKRYELGVSGGVPAFSKVTLAEGIENLQVDYGVDTDSDGAPNGTDVTGSALGVADWPNVMSLKLYLLARSTELTPGFQDTKSYALGVGGSVSAATGEEGYKRHVFVQSVRANNPNSRRAL